MTATKETGTGVRDFARKPECPQWCLSTWCDVRPTLTDGIVWGWAGFHIGEMRSLDVNFGYAVQVGIAAPEDDPTHMGIYVRFVAHEDQPEEIVAFFEDSEARLMSHALGRITNTLECYNKFYETEPATV